MQVGRDVDDATTGRLARLLTDPLVVIDAGCRWGFADHWHRLGDRCLAIGFDPDRAECERLAEQYGGSPSVRLVPQGLGSEPGTATLYLTKNPVGHSMMPTVTDVVERHPALEGGRVVGTSTVEVTSLDHWCEQEDVPRVDVIKIDTQGSELDILRGADRTLDAVRAVEVEVEFNELYHGVPLFGEIDRYLRDKGFVLWRLRDMAHYAQRGVARDWWSEEFFYYDDLMARFLTGGGQLFWANAFYLRRSVAYPSAEAGWEALIRDACITSALSLPDLVGLALERIGDTAPDEVTTTVADILKEERGAPPRPEASAVAILDGTVLLEVDDPRFTGWGWRAPQRLEFGGVRWSGPAREAWIEVPYRLGHGTRIELLVVAAMNTEILDGLSLEVNRAVVALERSPHEHGIVFSGVLSSNYSSDRPYTRVVIRTVDTIPWNSLHSESWDDTELGVALSWLRITAR
ncbi:MAG: FkbM family methyltransferase [Actinobacteria bacterium]|nr:FkbM family methyltransferase [Actinomycetota bacterium]